MGGFTGGGGRDASGQGGRSYDSVSKRDAERFRASRDRVKSKNKSKSKSRTTTNVTNDGNDRNEAPPKKPTQPQQITEAQIGTLSDPREKDDTAAKADLFREQGATNIKDTPMVGAGAALKPVFQAGSRNTRDYFKQEVLGKGAYTDLSFEDFESKSLTEQEDIYQDYIQGRTAGTKDAYGRDVNKPKDEAPKGIEVAKAASSEPLTESVQKAAVETAPDGPTSVEMDSEEDEAKRLLRIKRKGRRATILNVPDEELTLSRRVLLG